MPLAPQDPLNRQIRVFISSTFRDMQRERELLVKHVFPELRRVCAKRFVTFTEVDLRWGITEEQAAEGKVLPICLEEIHLSRPYFIGLLGERYGWILQSVPPQVLANEPWLQEHVGQRTSVTDLEILHGVLNNPQMADHAYFYFRDPAYVDSIPKKDRKDFTAENAEGAEKLRNLKERIRKSGLPVVENYANPDALAAKVSEHLLALADLLYPEGATPDPLDQEALGHESHAARKLLAYVPRPVHTAALNAFISGESIGLGLVVTGDSGSGKTTLLADWVRHWRVNHPNDFVFAHYFGSTPDSASAPRFLHRLLGELKRLANIPDEIPSTPQRVREILALWLAQVSTRISSLALTGGGTLARVVLVLDALNQIEGDDPNQPLAWLPHDSPPHLRVLVSALPGPALDVLYERGWAEHKLLLPGVTERAQMIEKFFEHYRKMPTPEMRNQLAAAPGSANPLFLRTVLEELRQFGSFEQLPTKVAEYLTAITPEELFRLVLHRWQQDFDADRDLVRHALCLLWAARQGLSETEWRELLGTPGEPLLRQIWSPLFLAMEPHLALRAGLHAFGHDYLRAAVRKQWLEGAETVGAFHMQLAAYFAKIAEPTGRKLNEQAWQLRRALEAPADMSRRQTAWQSLWETLTDASWARAVINSGAAAELVDDYVALHEASDSNLSKDRVGQALEALMRDAQGKVGVPPLSVANVNAWIVYRPDKALLELLFAHVLAEEPPANDAAARRFYAACAIRSGGMRRRDAQFDTAEQLFAKVRAIFDGDGGADDSEQSTLEYEIGYVHFLRGNFDAAIHHFHLSSEHARKAGNSVGEWISRCLEGNVRFMSGRNTGDEFKRVLDEANRTFTDAASVNPDALRWVMNVKGHHFDVAVLSNNALEAGKWNRALQDDRWISLFESKWDVVRSGRLALVQGRFADAVADLQSYLSKLGDGAARAEQAARVYLELGRALDGDGKREAAVEKWNDGLRICRDDCGNRLWKAQIQNELSAV